MSYSDRGKLNTAVSQFSGSTAPQSGGGCGDGVTIVRMIEMLPGFSRWGSENTSWMRSRGSSTSLIVPSFITARSWTLSHTSPSMRSLPALPSRMSLPLPPSRTSPAMKPTPLTPGIAGAFRSAPNAAISWVSPAIVAALAEVVVLSGTAAFHVVAAHRAETREEVEDVSAVAEHAAVVAFAVVDPVVAVAAEDAFSAHRAVDEDVVARAAEVLDAVVAAEQEVVPVAADLDVAAEPGSAGQRVVARTALQDVVAVAAEEDV